MKRIRKYIIMTVVIVAVYFARDFFMGNGGQIVKSQSQGGDFRAMDELVVYHVNKEKINLQVDGKTVDTDLIYMQKNREIMVASSVLSDTFRCGVHVYNNSKLVIERYDTVVEFIKGSKRYFMNGQEMAMELPLVCIDQVYYLPLKTVASALGFRYQWDSQGNCVQLGNQNQNMQFLPYKYDLRDKNRVSDIKNQGNASTCWAVAALSAIESCLLPEETLILAPDHMNHRNSFTLSENSGGEYTMAVAYLTAWQGPVLEEEDTYGDDVSPENLKPRKHVQEARFIEAKNYSRIKEMIFKYGAVESSIYSTIQGNTYHSKYYNQQNSAYCYVGEEKPNHEILIIGWDDSYSKSNFSTEAEGDGAFICQNSWGVDFGDQGVFYVSYYDTNIGIYNVSYTGIEDVDNYDNIYQSDLCGWTGHLGYERENAMFANVYTAQKEEILSAVGFYALGKDTEYNIYVVENFQDKISLGERRMVKTGYLEDAGFYTIDIPEGVLLQGGSKFAVIVDIKTPGSQFPVAIEFPASEATSQVDLEDGEGYISLSGNTWECVEEKQGCNLCLKAYTREK